MLSDNNNDNIYFYGK